MYALGTMNYNTSSTPFEMDLCNLLQTMKLDGSDLARYGNYDLPKRDTTRINIQDDAMDEANYQSDGTSEFSSASSESSVALDATTITTRPVIEDQTYHGCAYLQTIREQLDNYPTTGGDYLEAIFTHREILSSFPWAHRDCAEAFSDLAFAMERRAWRADRDADTEAVTAFRHEAWMIASTLSPPPIPTPTASKQGYDFSQSNFPCVIPPMY